MESEWGAGCSFYGVGSTGATLCARVLGGTAIVLITNAFWEPGYVLLWQVQPETGFGQQYNPQRFPTGGKRFPYDLPVGPNVPW